MRKVHNVETDTNDRPVTILTGYLGAGKTTFLNSLMAANPDIRYAIIENEIGERGIDSQLIAHRPDDFIELENGCLCCTLNGSLYDAIEQMHWHRDRFDELIIECTGLALPAAIAEPFLSHPVIKSAFPLKRMVCLVDAELIEDQLADREEAIRQITASDVIVINKTDLVHADYTEELKHRLARINPFARVFTGRGGGFPMCQIAQIFHKPAPAMFYVPSDVHAGGTSNLLGERSGSHRHSDVSSRSFDIAEEFDVVRLFLNLYSFFALHGGSVYRMKGMVYQREAKANTRRIFIQSVGGRLGIETGPPWKKDEKLCNLLTFIGKDLGNLDIGTMLRSCLNTKENNLLPRQL